MFLLCKALISRKLHKLQPLPAQSDSSLVWERAMTNPLTDRPKQRLHSTLSYPPPVQETHKKQLNRLPESLAITTVLTPVHRIVSAVIALLLCPVPRLRLSSQIRCYRCCCCLRHHHHFPVFRTSLRCHGYPTRLLLILPLHSPQQHALDRTRTCPNRCQTVGPM